MDLNETIISSFFFHLILFLLMIAVSSLTTGSSGTMQNIVSVDLTKENDRPDTAIDPAEKQPPAAGTPSLDEASSPEKSENTPSEMSVPEARNKVESTQEPAKIEKAEKPPAEIQGPPSLEAYYRFLMLHKEIFTHTTSVRVNELLGEAFKVNTREFYGGKGTVSLQYGSDRKLSKVIVESASSELKDFLEEIIWDAVPAPAEYSLGFTEVHIEFTVFEGYMSFKIDVL